MYDPEIKLVGSARRASFETLKKIGWFIDDKFIEPIYKHPARTLTAFILSSLAVLFLVDLENQTHKTADTARLQSAVASDGFDSFTLIAPQKGDTAYMDIVLGTCNLNDVKVIVTEEPGGTDISYEIATNHTTTSPDGKPDYQKLQFKSAAEYLSLPNPDTGLLPNCS